MLDVHLEQVHWARPAVIPPTALVGREDELALSRAAWGLDNDYRPLNGAARSAASKPLHFRLEGPPGVGKNAIVYEVARRVAAELGTDLYMMAGHEEMTPEDLTLLIVPHAGGNGSAFALRASPLATAIRKGGIFFFDEINRVPERALSPLASVLDERQEIISAITGLTIRPENEDARKRFRFCCALNPALGDSGYVLPDYIEQRTLPVIPVDNPPLSDLLRILERTLRCPDSWLRAFENLFRQGVLAEVSIRQALSLMTYAIRMEPEEGVNRQSVIQRVLPYFLRTPGGDAASRRTEPPDGASAAEA
jgi:MoxR-like ATPase